MRELTDRLSALAPVDDARIFLGSGGGDAIDTAAKLARRYFAAIGTPERVHLISRSQGYHGTHGLGTSIGGIPVNAEGVGPLDPATSHVQHDSLQAMESEIERVGADRVAAIFAEPVIGAGGVHQPPPGYIEGLAALCERTGILLVIDAVIGAFGRLGTWFAAERFGVRPDMITFAKGVTSGHMPLGGVVVSGKVAEPFWEHPGAMFRHGPTYAGHPACCAAALANLGVLGRERLLERGRDLERPLFDALAPFAQHEAVSEIRGGTGLMAAVELSDDVLKAHPGAVAKVVGAAREAGVIVRPLGRAVAVSPPLTVTTEHFGMIAEALDQALDSLLTSLSGAR